MIRHIVMWRLLDEAEGKTKKENAEAAKRLLLALREKIPQIKEMQVASDMGLDGNYDLVLEAEFESREDLETYQRHIDHVRAAGFVSKIRKERAAIDYES